MPKPRMTVNEVIADMKSRGLGIGHKTLTDGMQSGLFPFGTMIAQHPTRRSFLILRKDYETWADANIGPIQ